MASASQPFNLNYGEWARPDLTSVLNAVRSRMSAFSRIQMTDVDSGPDGCFPSAPLADWTDISFPTTLLRHHLKPALPHSATWRLQHTLHSLIYFFECRDILIFTFSSCAPWLGPQSHPYVLHHSCFVATKPSPATSSIPSGIRDEIRRPVVSLGRLRFLLR